MTRIDAVAEQDPYDANSGRKLSRKRPRISTRVPDEDEVESPHSSDEAEEDEGGQEAIVEGQMEAEGEAGVEEEAYEEAEEEEADEEKEAEAEAEEGAGTKEADSADTVDTANGHYQAQQDDEEVHIHPGSCQNGRLWQEAGANNVLPNQSSYTEYGAGLRNAAYGADATLAAAAVAVADGDDMGDVDDDSNDYDDNGGGGGGGGDDSIDDDEAEEEEDHDATAVDQCTMKPVGTDMYRSSSSDVLMSGTENISTSGMTTSASTPPSPSPSASSAPLPTRGQAPAAEAKIMAKVLATWTAHAQSATVHGLVQTLQAWLRVARNQQQQHCELSLQRLELPPLVDHAAAASVSDDLAVAVRAFRICERATAIGSQAVLCRRLCYANLYRLNERTREQVVQGSGCRSQLFQLCYPEFANRDGTLDNLTSEARTALRRLSRDIHFGGTICRFADRFSCPEAAILLQPAIPDRFLRKLTATQLDYWAGMVRRVATPTSRDLHCLWKATAMLINQAVDLQSCRFPLEDVRFDGSWYVDVNTNRLVQASFEHLLTPVPLASLWHAGLETERPFRASMEHLSILPALDVPQPPIQSFRLMRDAVGRDLQMTGSVITGSVATHMPWDCSSHCVVEEEREKDGCHNPPDSELPSSVFGGRGIWEDNDEFRQALGYVGDDAHNVSFI